MELQDIIFYNTNQIKPVKTIETSTSEMVYSFLWLLLVAYVLLMGDTKSREKKHVKK